MSPQRRAPPAPRRRHLAPAGTAATPSWAPPSHTCTEKQKKKKKRARLQISSLQNNRERRARRRRGKEGAEPRRGPGCHPRGAAGRMLCGALICRASRRLSCPSCPVLSVLSVLGAFPSTRTLQDRVRVCCPLLRPVRGADVPFSLAHGTSVIMAHGGCSPARTSQPGSPKAHQILLLHELMANRGPGGHPEGEVPPKPQRAHPKRTRCAPRTVPSTRCSSNPWGQLCPRSIPVPVEPPAGPGGYQQPGRAAGSRLLLPHGLHKLLARAALRSSWPRRGARAAQPSPAPNVGRIKA